MQVVREQTTRRGAVVPLVALLLVFIVGMVAFAVDMGYIAHTRLELQNASDAAALAGASQLLEVQLQTTFSSALSQEAVRKDAIQKARAEAQKFGQLNQGGSSALVVNDSDITVGYLDSPAWKNTLQPTPPDTRLPNSVQVLVRRDSTVSTGPLTLFFAPVLGIRSTNVHARATATFQGGTTITGFKGTPGGPNSLLLPMAIDYELWTLFLTTGISPDGTRHDEYTAQRPTADLPAPNNVGRGSDSIPEFTDVYPNDTAPGNFGLLNIGPPANDTPTFREWMRNGSTPSDLAYFGSEGLQASLAKPAKVKGGPGLKSTLQTDLQSIIGQSRIIPLYSTYSGTGSNTEYTIVGFAGVTIVKAEGRGNNMEVTLQPLTAIDRTATTGPASPDNVSKFVYRPLALTR